MNDIPIERELPEIGERYVIEAVLGEGATGAVYRALDRQLDRRVAVKILESRDQEETERFQREASAQARIDHEHVCRVFDVGEIEGRGFLAMQLVRGTPLRDLSSELDLTEKVTVLEQAARAIHAAHATGVVHRDLKPGNIMVERRADGTLHATVLDFGIAGKTGARDDVPMLSSGTPAFMAPEQIRGGESDSRVDVYGLGATLYGVLAEQAPFFGATRADVESMVLDEDPVRVGLVVPGTPEDLETIVHIAMAKDPRRRYPDARSLADDLARWIRGEPIKPRVGNPIYRLGTWLKTRRIISAVVILAVSIGAAAVVTSLWLRERTEQRRLLVEWHHNEVDRIDRLLRRARMMPLHDTTSAENAVRQRLSEVESKLLEHGPLARGPAYFALGFGHLMLRDLERSEEWLQEAVDAGYGEPEVVSALGITEALLILRSRAPYPADGGDADVFPEVESAVAHLSASSPATAERDAFHRALRLHLEGRDTEALAAARLSAKRVPWLYEARQLEGDILVARALERERSGDSEGARRELVAAGSAYGHGLAVARSDPWLLRAEAERLLLLAGSVDPGDPDLADLAERAIRAAEDAFVARPGPAAEQLTARAQALIRESRGANGG
jgi:serine/threonine-protein kinase